MLLIAVSPNNMGWKSAYQADLQSQDKHWVNVGSAKSIWAGVTYVTKADLAKARTSATGKQVFFFQAEDGIRDVAVTGVQTCALPISVALAALLETLAERAEFQAAEAADERYRLAEQFPTTMQAGWLIAGRGRLRLAEQIGRASCRERV